MSGMKNRVTDRRGELDHGLPPGAAGGIPAAARQPPSARIRSRPTPTTQLGRMLMNAM